MLQKDVFADLRPGQVPITVSTYGDDRAILSVFQNDSSADVSLLITVDENQGVLIARAEECEIQIAYGNKESGLTQVLSESVPNLSFGYDKERGLYLSQQADKVVESERPWGFYGFIDRVARMAIAAQQSDTTAAGA